MKTSFHFDSIAELADAASSAPEEANARSPYSDALVSFADALTMARRGWEEGSDKAKRALERIELPRLETSALETYMDVQGEFVDIGTYMRGVPECAFAYREDKRTALFARIVVSGSYSGAVTPEQAINRGCAIAAVIDALETRGIRCDVMVHRRVESRHRMREQRYGVYCDVTIQVKRADEPLNLDTLTFALAHPAFLRRLIWGLMDSQTDPKFLLHFGSERGYGNPALLADGDADTLTFQTARYQEDWSEAGARAKVDSTLQAYDATHGVMGR